MQKYDNILWFFVGLLVTVMLLHFIPAAPNNVQANPKELVMSIRLQDGSVATLRKNPIIIFESCDMHNEVFVLFQGFSKMGLVLSGAVGLINPESEPLKVINEDDAAYKEAHQKHLHQLESARPYDLEDLDNDLVTQKPPHARGLFSFSF